MGVLVVDYSSFSSAANNAANVASKARDYANALDRQISSKLCGLTGGSSAYTNNAEYYVRQKITRLQQNANRFDDYAARMRNLKTSIESSEKSLKTSIQSMGKGFRAENGMKTSIFGEFITRLKNFILDKSGLARWLNGIFNSIKGFAADLYANIRDWYRVQGGKYVVKIITSIVALLVAIVTFSGGILAFIALCFTLVNAYSNIVTNLVALQYQHTDPAWASRYGKMEKLSDVLRGTVTDSKLLNTVLRGMASFLEISEGIVNGLRSIQKLHKSSFTVQKLFGDEKSGLRSLFCLSDGNGGYTMNWSDFSSNLKTLVSSKEFRSALAKDVWKGMKQDVQAFKDTIRYSFKSISQLGDTLGRLVGGDADQSARARRVLWEGFVESKFVLDWAAFNSIDKNKFPTGIERLSEGIKNIQKTVKSIQKLGKLTSTTYKNMDALLHGEFSKVQLPDTLQKLRTGSFGYTDLKVFIVPEGRWIFDVPKTVVSIPSTVSSISLKIREILGIAPAYKLPTSASAFGGGGGGGRGF